jgi:hypothetical protein
MEEPTNEQKMQAAMDALAELGIQDKGEAARHVAVFWAQAALLPKFEAPATPPVLVTSVLTSEDPDLQARIYALGQEAKDIVSEIVCGSETPPPEGKDGKKGE